MPENEVAFLLRLLNQEYPDGRDDSLLVASLTSRLLTFGLIAEYSMDHNRWYVHLNDGKPFWDQY